VKRWLKVLTLIFVVVVVVVVVLVGAVDAVTAETLPGRAGVVITIAVAVTGVAAAR
jgi:hypothetical protein